MSIEQTRSQRAPRKAMNDHPEQIQQFIDAVSARVPGSSIGVDSPRDPTGEWFIDVEKEGFKPHVAWREASGFGLFTAEEGFGDYPNEVYRKADLAATRVVQLYAEWQKSERVSPVRLAQLRQLLDMQQAELAAVLSLKQSAISRFENRDDVKISTLNTYVMAMGGRLEMRVHFPDLDVSINPLAVATG